MFIAALLTIGKTWKCPKYLSRDERINEICGIYCPRKKCPKPVKNMNEFI